MQKQNAVERYEGTAIQLPTKPREMTIPIAMEVLHKQHQLETTIVEFNDSIPVYPFDGAIALDKALTQLYGMTLSADKVPAMKSVAVSATETRRIPWGAFAIPGLKSATIETEVGFDENNQPVFRLTAMALMRDQPSIEALFALTRQLALSESIYRGKIVQFTDNGSGRLPNLTFKTVSDMKPIFAKALENSIERNILVPIWYKAAAQRLNIPMKRGILLAGEPGVGKTLLTAYVSHQAVANDWTVVEVTNPYDLPAAIEFVRRLGPTVLLVEDIDRIVGSERTDTVNEILNLVDGPATKTMDLIMLFTSNHPEQINVAMRRDGRIDKTFAITAPDAEAVSRLLRHFGGIALDANADLTEASRILSGQPPSKIRETAERAKLEALRRTQGQTGIINGADLAATAEEILEEATLFAPATDDFHPMERIGMGIANRLGKTLKTAVANGNGTAE